MLSRLLRVLSVLGVMSFGACGGGGSQHATCVPGASVECTCLTGQHGAQVCASDGTFGTCQCRLPEGTVDAQAASAEAGLAGTGGGPSDARTAGAGGTIGAGGAGGGGGTSNDGGVVDAWDAASAQSDTPTIAMGGSTGGTPATGGITGTGGVTRTAGTTATAGITATAGTTATAGRTSTGGATGMGGSSVVQPASPCGNGVVDTGEVCDCGIDRKNLPKDCKGVNGLFYGDGKGCSKTCTKEPSCQDSTGKTVACTSTCGDGNVDPGEGCDDGNGVGGDGCSKDCKVEVGFTCSTQILQDTSPCASGSGQCLELPMIYRDFQPENVANGGHPDFPFLGTRFNGSKSPTTICVPNAGGPSKGNDSTARCVGMVAATLLNGRPQPGTTTTCDCQFSDWNVGNSNHIPGNYTSAGNDSPLSDGNGGYLGGSAGSPISTISTAGAYTGTITAYTASTPGGPIFHGKVPAYKNAASLKQWFTDDPSVNKTYTDVLELAALGSNIYQYASVSHLAQGGFFPLDKLVDASLVNQCNLWPYWNHGNGSPIWSTCTGDQYLFPPLVLQSDCPNQNPLSNGCWVTSVPGVKHDAFFTSEARYYFGYDGMTGIHLSFYGDDDLFVFINGTLVLDLGGTHQPLPGRVSVTGSPGDADVIEGGCLDTAGNIVGAVAGSTACSPTNSTKPPAATTPDDFRVRTVPLGLTTGKVYEIAIFGANRKPTNSDYQITLNGYTTKRSVCQPTP